MGLWRRQPEFAAITIRIVVTLPCLCGKIDFCRSTSPSQPGQSRVPNSRVPRTRRRFSSPLSSPPNSSGPARWVLGLDNSNSLDAVPSRPAPKRLRAAKPPLSRRAPEPVPLCVTFLVETSNPTLILESGSKDSAATRNCWFRKEPHPPDQAQHTSTTLLGPCETAHRAGPSPISTAFFSLSGLAATDAR